MHATQNTLHAEIDTLARNAARRARRGFPWAEQAELEQEARLFALGMLPGWDPAAGPLAAYCWHACTAHLGTWLLQQSSPVSASATSTKRGRLKGMARVDVDENAAGAGEPEADLRRSQVRALVTHALSSVPDAELAAQVLLEERTSAEVAQRTGVAVARVYRATWLAREALRACEALRDLWEVA